MWQAWFGVVPEETIDLIIAECDKYPVEKATIGPAGETVNDKYRNSDVSWVDPNVPESNIITNMIMYHVNYANRQAFGFNIGSQIYDIQYTIYNGDSKNPGEYKWHMDSFLHSAPRSFDRKLSVIIQLSDSDDYEGGDFLLDPGLEGPPPEEMRKKGTIFIFPSFLKHCVTPVTSGTRKSLVSWIEGPKFI